MILQALYDYYLRRQADVDPARRLPAFGLELKEIGFILEVDESGQLHAIIDTRQMSGKKKIGTSYLVPKGCWRRFKSDQACRLNFDQGPAPGFLMPGCG